jgi:hypothetical protein
LCCSCGVSCIHGCEGGLEEELLAFDSQYVEWQVLTTHSTAGQPSHVTTCNKVCS